MPATPKVAVDQRWRSVRNNKLVVVLEVRQLDITPCARVAITDGRGQQTWLTCSRDGTKINGYRLERTNL